MMPRCNVSWLQGSQCVRLKKPRSGVYFLRDHSGDVIYVGQSIDVEMRIRDHSRYRDHWGWEEAWFIPVAREHLTPVESAFIRFYRPRINRTEGIANWSDDARILIAYGVPADAVADHIDGLAHRDWLADFVKAWGSIGAVAAKRIRMTRRAVDEWMRTFARSWEQIGEEHLRVSAAKTWVAPSDWEYVKHQVGLLSFGRGT
jgi:hypothetical protein